MEYLFANYLVFLRGLRISSEKRGTIVTQRKLKKMAPRLETKKYDSSSRPSTALGSFIP